MRFLTASLVAIAATTATAVEAAAADSSSPMSYTDATITSTATSSRDVTRTVESFATPTSQTSDLQFSEWDKLPHGLKQFLFDMSPQKHLGGRQNAAQGGGQGAVPLSPTQLSPTTVYDAGKGPTTYIQTFAPTPSQYSSPQVGSIGMGTIQGQYGKTRTYDNPAPTAFVDRRVMLAVAGGIGAGFVL